MNRFDPSVFNARGVVAIGYAAFAFALGVATGALTRRTLPAMAVTLLGFVAARFAFTLRVRPHLLASRHVLLPLTMGKEFPLGFPSDFGVFMGLPWSRTPSVTTSQAVSSTRSRARRGRSAFR
jgi:hypothetical protein